MSKETLLKEFDRLTKTLKADFITDGFSAYDELKQFISHAIDQTREETIMEQAIHVATQSSNQEQKKLVDEYDRIEEYYDRFRNLFGKGKNPSLIELDELLSEHAQEVRKEVLEEVEKEACSLGYSIPTKELYCPFCHNDSFVCRNCLENIFKKLKN